jgi:hypothetical protein
MNNKKREIDRENSSKEAIKRYDLGEEPGATCSICDNTVYGYGECYDYGFFEFPLVFKE